MYRFWKQVIKWLGVLSIIFSIVLVIFIFQHLKTLQDPESLAKLLKGKLFVGSVVFFLLQVVQVVIPIIPGGVTTVVGFMIFGSVWGFVLNYTGIIVGSIILFVLTRRFGKPFILLFIETKTFYRYEKKLSHPTYEKFFILNMLSPISPADILVMVTGLSQMTYQRFITIILICKPVSILAYSYLWIYGGHFIKQFL